MDNVVPYIHDRKQFGQSIGEFQLIQGKVADMYTVLQAGRAFCYTVGKNLDALGSEHVRQVRKDCASVILWCAEKATWMAGEGIQISGADLVQLGIAPQPTQRVVVDRSEEHTSELQSL